MASMLLAIAAPPAHACSLVPTYLLDLENLKGSDPSDPLAGLQEDYAAWAREVHGDPVPDYVTGELPPLVAVWYERAVIAVDPPADHYASTGGVSVVDAIWGDYTPANTTLSLALDTTSCAGAFPLPEPGEFHLVFAGDDWVAVEAITPESVDDVERIRAVLDEVFGDAASPERDAEAESDALDEVLVSAERDGVADGPPPRHLDPLAEPTVAVASDGDFPWVIVPMIGGALALGLLFAVRPWRRR